jgi:hypothetical protein
LKERNSFDLTSERLYPATDAYTDDSENLPLGKSTVKISTTLNVDANGCGETEALSTKLDGVTPQPIQPGEEHLNFSALLVSSVNILRKK